MKKKEKDIGIADYIKGLDFYKDLPKDLQEPSVSGASGKEIKNKKFSFNGGNGTYGTDVYIIDISIHAILKVI